MIVRSFVVNRATYIHSLIEFSCARPDASEYRHVVITSYRTYDRTYISYVATYATYDDMNATYVPTEGGPGGTEKCGPFGTSGDVLASSEHSLVFGSA